MPKRVQRKRIKGWRKPEGAVCVTRPGKFGNPFYVTDNVGLQVRDQFAVDSRDAAISMYKRYLLDPRTPLGYGPPEVRDALAGKDLCCYCPLDKPCHADVLLEVANA